LSDWPSDVPALAGTWQIVSEGRTIATFVLDQTGDPRYATISSDLLSGAVSFDVPTLVLDGVQRRVTIQGFPFAIGYAGRAVVVKQGSKNLITPGETLSATTELQLYLDVPVGLSSGVFVGKGTITYQGSFVSENEAVGSVRSILELSQQALDIAQSFGIRIPMENLDTTTSNVRFIRS